MNEEYNDSPANVQAAENAITDRLLCGTKLPSAIRQSTSAIAVHPPFFKTDCDLQVV